mgnify:CR=1 FL=1
MRQAKTLALVFALVLTVGIVPQAVPAAPHEPAAQREGEEYAPVTEGAKVTIAFTIAIPEVNEMITGNVSKYVAGEKRSFPHWRKH